MNVLNIIVSVQKTYSRFVSFELLIGGNMRMHPLLSCESVDI